MTALLSFRDVSSIQWLQRLIVVVRYITLATMVAAAIVHMNVEGVQPFQIWDSDATHNLLGTAVYAYIMNHSLPQMFYPVHPKHTIK
jgi:hypothetical protein